MGATLRRGLVTAAGAAALGAALWAGSAYETRTQRAGLERVMREEGTALVEALGHAVENADDSAREIDELASSRLLDVARLVARLDAARQRTDEELDALAAELDLRSLAILPAESEGAPAAIAPLLRGEADVVVFPTEDPAGFAAAVRRSRGGAVVAVMDASEMLAFRESTGAAHLVAAVAGTGGILYAVLEDADGAELVREPATPLPTPGVLELERPVALASGTSGRLRVGLSTDGIAAAYRAARRRNTVGAALAFLVAAAALAAWSARERLGRERGRAKELAAYGRLAEGVAHEVRNPLNAIAVGVQRLGREHVPREGAAEHARLVSLVREEIDRLDGIVTRFLEYARPPKLAPEDADLAALVTAYSPLLSASLPEGVRLEIDAPGPVPARVDPRAVRQILHNLVRNAAEAIDGGGAVRISARTRSGRAVLDVDDDGPGVSPADRKRAFEPGFTTRAAGSGLGLPTVRRLAEEMGGSAELVALPGGGTRARVTLPGDSHRPPARER